MKEDFMEGKSGNTGHNELFYFGMQQQTHDVRTMHNYASQLFQLFAFF